MSQAMNTSIPILKPKNNIQLNNNIKKLQKTKSSLITLLNRLIRTDPPCSRWITKLTKSTLKIVKKILIQKFSKALDSFWSAQIKKLITGKQNRSSRNIIGFSDLSSLLKSATFTSTRTTPLLRKEINATYPQHTYSIINSSSLHPPINSTPLALSTNPSTPRDISTPAPDSKY